MFDAELSPVLRYEFIPVEACEMCGSRRFRAMGLRLNRSQGRRPKEASGIAVSVKKCLDCELVFSDPRPKPADLNDHYGIPPESYWVAPDAFDIWPEYFATEIRNAKELLGFRPGMAALDVGAGLGKAMVQLNQAGFQAWGLEPSPQFRDRAISAMGIDPKHLVLSSVEEATFGPQFDFVSFGAVLEHLQEPGQALLRALSWLKPGGVIQAEVPSSRHLIAKFLNAFFALNGTNYVTNLSPMHSPFHLYEFSAKSFEAHAALHGYEVARRYHEVCPIRHVPKFLHPPLRAYMEATDTGLQLHVYLRKPAR